MSEPSSNMKPILILCNHPSLKPIILPTINIERDSIDWERLGYHGQSGGVQTVISWMYCLFCDSLPPKEWNYRDPFDGFFALDREIQILVFEAFAIRHGFIKISLEDRPKSKFQLAIEKELEELKKHVPEKLPPLRNVSDDDDEV